MIVFPDKDVKGGKRVILYALVNSLIAEADYNCDYTLYRVKNVSLFKMTIICSACPCCVFSPASIPACDYLLNYFLKSPAKQYLFLYCIRIILESDLVCLSIYHQN